MTNDALLRQSLATIEVNDTYSEAVVGLTDGSRLRLHHRVGERWIRAEPAKATASLAATVLATIARFRLNGKHLDVEFADGSRWEARFAIWPPSQGVTTPSDTP